jgi:two-component system response regulator NreC
MRTATEAPPQDDGLPAPGPLDVLTDREREVAIWLARGYNHHEIADELDISVKTVDTHRGKLLKKLKLPNNVTLTHLCLKVGVIELI